MLSFWLVFISNYPGLGSIPPGFFQMVDKWVMNAYIICSLYSWAIFSLKQCESPMYYVCMSNLYGRYFVLSLLLVFFAFETKTHVELIAPL